MPHAKFLLVDPYFGVQNVHHITH